jgi:pyruvate dehydrogenase E2 component (dihydrolipoamide acetyltransferase)
MAEKIIMPKQGLQMTEGTITKWLVQEGETVTEGEPLFEMETDKLTIVIDANTGGTLLKIIAGPGDVVPITEMVAIVGAPGEDIEALLAEAGAADDGGEVAPASEAGEATSAAPAATSGSSVAPPVRAPGERVFSSPRARTRAAELGIGVASVAGSAPDGMVIERDVLAAAKAGAAVRATPLARGEAARRGANLAGISGSGPRGKVRRADVLAAASGGGAASSGERSVVPMSGMRRIIAERMKRSQVENAQTTHRITVRMDEAFRLREALDKTVGFNDIISFATINALRDFPAMNAELVDEGVWQKDFVNMGIAVAVDSGLIVPVVKDADLMSLPEFSAAAKALAEKARGGGLEQEDYTGGTFTVSNLGMYGLDDFVAIINPPEAGILAVGKIEDVPVVVDGRVEVHPVVRLTLSYDHRVVDGAPAAEFLARVKEYLENPYKLLLTVV